MTRHDLKEQVQHDPFAESVAKVVDYTSTHRSDVMKWVAIALAAAVVISGVLWYLSYAQDQRRQDLEAAFQVVNASVGPSAAPGTKNFPTEDAKRQAEIKALTDVVNKDGGSHEGKIAQYYRGTLNVQKDPKAAEADLKAVADSGGEMNELAKVALAQIYSGSNRVPEAQAVLRALIDHPGPLVSKAQAQILLAQLDQTANPQEAKNLLNELKKNPDLTISRAAEQLAAQPGH